MTSRLQKLFDKLSLPNWYAVFAGALLGIWLVARFTQQMWCWFRKSRHVSGLRRLRQSSLPKILQQFDICTYLGGLMIILLLALNVFILTLGNHSTTDICRRAGILGVVHFIPLWTGLTFGLPADILGINRTTLAWLHRWIGRICMFQSILHGTMVLARAESPILAMKHHYIPLLVCKKSSYPAYP